jgi:hypothetical protein
MARIVFHDCGIHVSLEIAGQKGKRVEALRIFVQDEIDKHYRLGDISPAEKKALLEEAKTHSKLFDTEEEMMNALIESHPKLANILKAASVLGYKSAVLIAMPHAEA